MFDKRLIRAINQGRCFILVGSGPSCEVGYPSWHQLAELTFNELTNSGQITDLKSYERYLADNKYPEFFRQAERDLGSRAALIELLKYLLSPTSKRRGVIYELITRWPFACYLTTNYDDEIEHHLAELQEHFTVLRNRQKDFYSIRDGADHIIQKLHSDLNYPDEVVLTSADYRRLYVEDSGKYFRDKLRQIFEMFDLLIVGHSLSDPDIGYVIQLAKQTANPKHPIFMTAADFSKADEKEYFEKYNIVLINYSNNDSSHVELRRLFLTANKFIVPRGRLRERISIAPRPQDEIDSATALFLYRRLHTVDDASYLSPLLLSGLFSASAGGVSLDNLVTLPSLGNFNKNSVFLDAVTTAKASLVQQNLAVEKEGNINITASGRSRVEECQAVRETEKDQAYGQFQLDLRDRYESLSDPQWKQCQQLAETVIIGSFANRGLAIANQVFSGQAVGQGELTDLFGYISESATEIEDMWLRAAFVEAMHDFLVEPNAPQRKYLASVSQGYFLYHLLGLDPNCSRVRQDIFQKTLWICDSSVILPLLAVGCYNHDYAVELFQALFDAKALLFTTRKLVQEAWEHFDWALQFIKNTGAESPEFLRAALLKGSYKQNLFLDGFIRLSADGEVGTFKDYLFKVFPKGEVSKPSFEALIVGFDIHLKDLSDLSGFQQDDWGDAEEIKSTIQLERDKRGTFRSALQIESEAEVWIIVKNLRTKKYSIDDGTGSFESIYFLSQSRILDQSLQDVGTTTWTPEALYRYLTALSGKETNPDMLQQCMLHEYYYAGVSFIDKDRYLRFFGPSIDAAKLSYTEEKDRYVNELEEEYTRNIDEEFENTPDLEKSFFVAQMGWRIAEESRRREEISSKRASEAEDKVRKLESEKDRAWRKINRIKQQEESARLRNLQDPKHMRKRLKQAKKRKKKK